MAIDWTIRWAAAEAEWVIECAIIVNLPDLAVEAMEAGWDSPSLWILAGMGPHDDARDVRDTFLSAVTELGRKLPDRDEAAERMIALYSSQVTRGILAPYEGARLIARLGYDFAAEVQDQVMTFVALEDEYSGRWGRLPEDVAAEIVQAARNSLRSDDRIERESRRSSGGADGAAA